MQRKREQTLQKNTTNQTQTKCQDSLQLHTEKVRGTLMIMTMTQEAKGIKSLQHNGKHARLKIFLGITGVHKIKGKSKP